MASLNQLKREVKSDFLSPVLINFAGVEDFDKEYKSEDEKWSENDSEIPKPEELVFNSFFSFIDKPEKLSDHQESGEYFEEDIITKDEDDNEVKEEKRQEKLSDFAVGEYFEEDIKPKDEDDTKVKELKRKADKLFNCPDCDFSTNYPTYLRRHELSLHSGVVRYFCPLCQYKSFFKNQVGYHIQSSHKDQNARIMLLDCILCKRGEDHNECSKSENRKAPKQFKCEKCEFVSSNRQSLKNHVSTRHLKINKYFCSLCGKKSYYRQHVKLHQLSHGTEPCRVLTIGCMKCEREEDHQRCFKREKAKIQLPESDQAKKPKRIKPDVMKQKVIKTGKYKCDECDYSHDKISIVKRHTESVHKGILKFFCRECEYKTYYRYAMILHMKSHGSSSDQPLRIGCEKCELNLAHTCRAKRTGKILKEKKNSNAKEAKEFRCDDCKISFPNIRKLNRHKLTRKHQGIVRFHCNICDFKHFFSLHVRIHQETNHADQICKILRIGCDDCDNDIQNHNCVRTQKSDQKPALNCEECPYSTQLRRNLFNHVQSVHLNLVRYYCSSCQYKSYFKKHVEIHLRQSHEPGPDYRVKTIGCDDCSDDVDHQCGKPDIFKCEICKYSTKIKKDLKIHTEVKHEKLVKFACSYCKRKSYYKHNLEKHAIKRHKNSDVEIREIHCPGCQAKVDHENCLRKPALNLHCHLCEYSTNAQTNLSHHIKKDHLKIVRFSCGKCEFKSFYRHHVAAHQLHNHRGEDCEIVKLKGDQKSPKRKMIRSQSAEGSSLNQFQCDQCDFSTQNEKSLSIHDENIHKDIKRYACSNCDYKAYFSCSVKNHLNHHKDEAEPARMMKIGCLPCASNVPHSCARKKRDVKRKGGERESWSGPGVECSLCTSRPSFASARLRLAHHKEVHPGQHIFNCEHCQYGTNYLPNLNTHRRSQHEKRRLQCELCDWWTTWNTSFHQHQRDKHGYFKKKSKHYSEGQQYLCDQCAFSTYSKAEFEKHKDHSGPTGFLRRSRSDQPGINSLTVKVDPAVLNARGKGRPFIVPLVPKAFKCNECEYSTDISGNLNAHTKAVHEGIMYQCDQCEYKSTSRHNLKVHVDNIHLGLRYKCESCEHVSTTRANLKLHNKTRHGVGGVRIQCNKCDYATFYVNNLRKHLATVHQNDKVNSS